MQNPNTKFRTISFYVLLRSMLDIKRRIDEQQKEEAFQRKLEAIRRGKYFEA